MRRCIALLLVVVMTTGCFHPKPPPPMKVKVGRGVSNTFGMMFYPETGTRFQKMFDAFDTIPGKVESTMIRLLLSHTFTDKSGRKWGRQWGPWKVFNDPTSGWNDSFWGQLRWVGEECKKRNISLGITLFDGNWISMDAFTTHYGKGQSSILKKMQIAYGGTLHPLQKDYIDKVMSVMDGIPIFFQDVNEQGSAATTTVTSYEEMKMSTIGIAAGPYLPSNSFRQSVIDYVDSKDSNLLMLEWKVSNVIGYDYRVIHSGVGTAGHGWVCNEEKLAGQWGGDYPPVYGIDFVKAGEARGMIPILAFWEWVWSKGKFAPSQIEALK